MEKIALIKFGGHALKDKNSLKTLIFNIMFLKKRNYKIIICHGGTPTINERLKKEKIKSLFKDGYRITTKKIMNVIEETVLGNEALQIIKKLNVHNLSAISLNGNDSFFIRCKKKKDYGFVGEIYDINTELIETLIKNDYIPLISPIGCDDQGNSYNLNSDYLASNIAKKINADLFLMITNVNGIYEDINNAESRIPIINQEKLSNLYKENKIGPQMKTKIDSMLDYVNHLQNTAYILNSSQKLRFEIFNTEKYGTKIVNKNIRLAFKEDIKNIMSLTKKSFIEYQKHIKYKIAPLHETKEDIFKDIINKHVFVYYKNNILIATARVKTEKNIAKISRICVNPQYQKKGIGSELLSYIENYLTKKGITYIGLTTLNNVKYLEKFYKKNNYKLLLTNTSRGYERAILGKTLKNEKENINTYWLIKQ